MRGRDERLQRHWRLRRKGRVVLGRIAPVRQVPGTHQHGRPLAVAKRHQHHRSLRHSRHRVCVSKCGESAVIWEFAVMWWWSRVNVWIDVCVAGEGMWHYREERA